MSIVRFSTVSVRSLCGYYSWSYLVNMTLIGNAVFVSMDIPDVFLAVRFEEMFAEFALISYSLSPVL